MASPTFDDRTNALAIARVQMADSSDKANQLAGANVVAQLSIYDILGAILQKVK